MTALFPSAAFFKPVGLAIGMAILFDCVMTFFGSTANDAALNAYITDVTTNENRGRVMGVVRDPDLGRHPDRLRRCRV